ncbi:MAG TPA: nucleotidyltransferase family protein, partial [Aggregatilineales bacterium]|nr:nucleotidyltransferase family protein [Aggregatilineales bacterium]
MGAGRTRKTGLILIVLILVVLLIAVGAIFLLRGTLFGGQEVASDEGGQSPQQAAQPTAPPTIDILVPRHAIETVEVYLTHAGWLGAHTNPYDERYYREWMHEIPPLRHRERGTEIDIHHRLLPRTSRLDSDPAPLFAAARALAD